ncbi:transmembrane protein 160-like [Ostrea edulis]|uniref:transmembrane protein 160-like n=1 Tax=Ostrea edulis TaxID=37623 RepID=UPI0024AEAC4D|nr:transmembrane protein 160-like [Ostrea edulis]XP_048737886.2 transmembrane protein 160-like [Ostrea edulis]
MAKTLRNLKTLRRILPWEHEFSLCHSRSKHLSATLGQRICCRVMCTKTDSKEKGYIYVDNKMSTEAIENSAWSCRLANENGYLSWCRNAYLMTGVGVGMLYKGQTAVAELAGYSAMFLAGVNVLWGTYVFVYNLLYLKDRVGMTGGFVALQTLSAIAHAILYAMILIVFSAESDKYFQQHSKEIRSD